MSESKFITIERIYWGTKMRTTLRDCFLKIVVILLLGVLSSFSETLPNKEDVIDLDTISSAPTEINAETMDFDIENRKATFSGNVHVVDEKLSLKSDGMTVKFDELNRLKRIEATGNVTIDSEGNFATGGEAVYDFKAGKITLSKNPILMQGPNRVIGAERIIYLREEKKFSTEGGHPQIIFFDGDGSKSFLEHLKKTEKK